VAEAWNILVQFAQLDEKMGPGYRLAKDLGKHTGCADVHAFMLLLKDKKLIISQKGRHGGYLLFKKPEEITLGDVLDAFGETSSASEADPFAIAMRVVRGAFRKITLADFLETEIDFEREVDMLDDLKKEVEKVRKTAKNPTRPIFPPALKNRIVAALNEHGVAAVGVALKMHAPQLYRWRNELTGQPPDEEIPSLPEDPPPPPRVYVRKDAPCPPPPPCPAVEIVEREAPVRVVQTIDLAEARAEEPACTMRTTQELAQQEDDDCAVEEAQEETGQGETGAAPTGNILCDITLRNGTNIRIYDA
jgi:transposase-like protein